MKPDAESIAAAGERLHRARRLTIVSHIRPDGDAVGSALGLAAALRAAGKTVTVALADGVPRSFQHLPGAAEVQPVGDYEADTVVFVDSADRERVGDAWKEDAPVHINIDHHITNTHYAEINVVDGEAVAAAALIAELLPQWGFEITPEAASALLTGTITDTIGFRTSNMNSKALRIAADLVDRGAPISELYYKALVETSFEALRYWGQGLSRLKRKDGVVWTYLTAEDRRIAGYTGSDDADLVNELATIREAQIAVVLIEQPDGAVKVSWRAKPGWDVSKLAVSFGGGGHAPAAGATVAGPLQSAVERVIGATLKLLQNG